MWKHVCSHVSCAFIYFPISFFVAVRVNTILLRLVSFVFEIVPSVLAGVSLRNLYFQKMRLSKISLFHMFGPGYLNWQLST